MWESVLLECICIPWDFQICLFILFSGWRAHNSVQRAFWSGRMFPLQENSCRNFALWAARHGNLMCSHQYKRQNLPLSLVIFVVLDWWVDNGLGCLELEQTVSWKGSFCPKLIPAFQLNVKGQSVKGELLSILLLTSYCPTCFLLTTLLFREYFHCYIIGFIPLKTFFLSEQLLLLPTLSFEIQLRAGSSGDAYD